MTIMTNTPDTRATLLDVIERLIALKARHGTNSLDPNPAPCSVDDAIAEVAFALTTTIAPIWR